MTWPAPCALLISAHPPKNIRVQQLLCCVTGRFLPIVENKEVLNIEWILNWCSSTVDMYFRSWTCIQTTKNWNFFIENQVSYFGPIKAFWGTSYFSLTKRILKLNKKMEICNQLPRPDSLRRLWVSHWMYGSLAAFLTAKSIANCRIIIYCAVHPPYYASQWSVPVINCDNDEPYCWLWGFQFPWSDFSGELPNSYCWKALIWTWRGGFIEKSIKMKLRMWKQKTFHPIVGCKDSFD